MSMEYGHRYGGDQSLKQKIRSSNCFSCCFRGAGDGEAAAGEQEGRPASLIRSSSVWLRSKVSQEIPEIKERCRTLMSRIGRQRRHSADFRYDPLSYALNFDEGVDDDEDAVASEEFRYRNFSSRLPASPPQAPHAAVGVACN